MHSAVTWRVGTISTFERGLTDTVDSKAGVTEETN